MPIQKFVLTCLIAGHSSFTKQCVGKIFSARKVSLHSVLPDCSDASAHCNGDLSHIHNSKVLPLLCMC